MFKWVKKLFQPTKVVNLPDNVQLTTDVGDSPMSFNLNTQVDVGIDLKTNTVKINIKSVGITSDGEISRQFIESASPKVVKDTIAMIALASGMHAFEAPQESFERRKAVSMEPTPEDYLPKDPALLN